VRRLTLPQFGTAGDNTVAQVLDHIGEVIADVVEPVELLDSETLRDAVISRVLDIDFGEIVIAGIAFAPKWGGDAVGFT
jgi:hypothetical protein